MASKRVASVAAKQELRAVYALSSYGRHEASESGDIDLLIDKGGSKTKGLFDMGGLYNDSCQACSKSIDLVTAQALEQSSTRKRIPLLIENIQQEKVLIYG